MKRSLLYVLSVVTISASALLAQGQRGAPAPPPPLEPGASQAEVDKALLAAPAQLRNQATVIKWNPSDWSYTTLRKGTNTMACWDKSGLPGQQAFSVECTHTGNIDRAAQDMKLQAITDPMARQAATDELEKSGAWKKPVFGSVWYHLMGQDQATARTHFTIAVPGATGATMGLPENGRGGGVWVMDAGKSSAHLMTPGE